MCSLKFGTIHSNGLHCRPNPLLLHSAPLQGINYLFWDAYPCTQKQLSCPYTLGTHFIAEFYFKSNARQKTWAFFPSSFASLSPNSHSRQLMWRLWTAAHFIQNRPWNVSHHTLNSIFFQLLTLQVCSQLPLFSQRNATSLLQQLCKIHLQMSNRQSMSSPNTQNQTVPLWHLKAEHFPIILLIFIWGLASWVQTLTCMQNTILRISQIIQSTFPATSELQGKSD